MATATISEAITAEPAASAKKSAASSKHVANAKAKSAAASAKSTGAKSASTKSTGAKSASAKSAATKAAKATGSSADAACPACANSQRKHTPRSEKLKKDVTTRCNRAIGQLNGIKAMIADDRYCGDVLTQLAAVECAVKAISREVMQDHLETCVVEKIQEGDVEVVDEVMSLFKKFM